MDHLREALGDALGTHSEGRRAGSREGGTRLDQIAVDRGHIPGSGLRVPYASPARFISGPSCSAAFARTSAASIFVGTPSRTRNSPSTST